MIKVEQLNYRVNTAQVLNNININISSAKVTTILGPNGAGKTSLLKCLSGTIKNYNGSIKYNGKDIHDYTLAELAKTRAVLSQANPVNFPFSVSEIVMMGRNPYLHQSNIKNDLEIVNELLNQVDAYQLKDRIFPTLSGGEQQRVQLARVLAQVWEQNNTTLFLDEPTSALDLKHQHQILQLVNKLANENSMSVICILHDLNLATYYADEAILMLDGGIFESGEINHTLTELNLEHVYQLPKDMIKQFHFNRSESNNRLEA
jgi:heme transport system ATP-binding protein